MIRGATWGQKGHRGIRGTIAVVATTCVFFPSIAEAWNYKTHVAIAYIAYHKLTRHTRERVNEVMVFHPLYAKWAQGAKLGQAGLLAFLYASMWPECIQDSLRCPGYTEDGIGNGFEPTAAPEEWQNIGFADHLMHKYWHFLQQPNAPSSVAVREAPAPNLQTQLHVFLDTLNSNAEDALKCYDLAWAENLMGDLHQLLHCITRFSHVHPAGDKCGKK